MYIATTTTQNDTAYDKDAYAQKMQERRKDLADKLENGLKELYASDKYAGYLKTMSKFPRYSSRNVMLIHMQMPGATRVAGASKWKSNFKRHPKKGEKAICIYAPVKNDKGPEKKMMEKIDPETGAPMLDKNGKIIMEEMTALDLSRMRYRPAPVFDVSQTDGKPLPEIVSPLNGDVERYEALLESLKAVSPLPIEFEKMPESQDGYCRFGEQIGIREGMSEAQTVAAIVHEIAHARMHDQRDAGPGAVHGAEDSADISRKNRSQRELEAESVAFAICDKYGVNSGENSFGYLATWAGHDPEMKQLKASLDIIQKEVGSLSRELDVHYAQALKKRGLEAEQPQQGQEKPETTAFEIGDYVVTGAGATLSGHGRITGLASDDYPGSNEHFIVDFGNAGTCTVHQADMAAEIVAGYKIMQRIELSDKEGVVLAHSPTAPDPYVTWQYIDRGGERDYNSGQYRQSEESALSDLHQRADTVSPNLYTSPPEAEAPAPEPTMATFPLYKGNLSDAVDRGETETYHKSRQLNFLCRDTIDRTIEEHRKSIPDAPAGACTYDMKAAVWSVISECGRERAEWVLAANINGASYDGRFSSENKEWAENTGAPERHDYHIQTHKAVLDGFARRFRESEKEKPPMSFLYAQAQERKKSAEAQKSGGDIERSSSKNPEER